MVRFLLRIAFSLSFVAIAVVVLASIRSKFLSWDRDEKLLCAVTDYYGFIGASDCADASLAPHVILSLDYF